MRYSLYKAETEEGLLYRLFVKTQNGPVKGFEFQSEVQAFSSKPGLTRMFGKQIHDFNGDYYLYPLDYTTVQVGEFNLIEDTQKFMKLEFLGEDNSLKGEWILRKLSNGQTLLWKPYPLAGEMTIDEPQNFSEGEIEVTQSYSIFDIENVGDNIFRGIAAAEGAWTGTDFRTTYFNKDIIESLGNDMVSGLDKMLVDFNHDEISHGKLTLAEVREVRGIKHIYVEGVTDKTNPVRLGSGLSIMIKSKLKWDSNLNIYVLISATALGVSVITESRPACTICMVR